MIADPVEALPVSSLRLVFRNPRRDDASETTPRMRLMTPVIAFSGDKLFDGDILGVHVECGDRNSQLEAPPLLLELTDESVPGVRDQITLGRMLDVVRSLDVSISQRRRRVERASV